MPVVVDDPLGAGQADLRPVDRRRVEVDEQVVVAEPRARRRRWPTRGRCRSSRSSQPAGSATKNRSPPPTSRPSTTPRSSASWRDDGAVGQRDDRLVDRPELGLGEDADLDGHAAAGQLDRQGRRGQQAGGRARAPSPGGSVTTRTRLGLGGGELAGQPLEEPVEPRGRRGRRRRRAAAGWCRRSGRGPSRCGRRSAARARSRWPAARGSPAPAPPSSGGSRRPRRRWFPRPQDDRPRRRGRGQARGGRRPDRVTRTGDCAAKLWNVPIFSV